MRLYTPIRFFGAYLLCAVLVATLASCGSSTDLSKSLSSTYTISGVVFIDQNSDGIYSTGDLGVSGCDVQLVNRDVTPAVVVASATSNAYGYYQLTVPVGSQGYLSVMKKKPPTDDYMPPFCDIMPDPSEDMIQNFEQQ